MATINITTTTKKDIYDYIEEDISEELLAGIRIYNTLNTFKPSTLEIYLNGMLLRKDYDYFEHSSSKGFTFLFDPTEGDTSLMARYITIRKNIDPEKYILEDLSEDLTAATQTYSTAYKYLAESLEVYLNGMLLRKNHEFSELSGRLSFTIVPTITTGDTTLIIKYIKE